MDVVKVPFLHGMCQEHLLDPTCLLDLVGDLFWVFGVSRHESRVRHFNFPVFVVFSLVVHNTVVSQSLHAFMPLNLCSLSVISMLSPCLVPALLAMSLCQISKQPSCVCLHNWLVICSETFSLEP
eukprot:gnl/MRDRNA2_/MRDRNA2_77725_c0_seq3.p2 gnl/MRDRNA2_/MRDRNA2_77725_c0~~gnl/MRDRNA2_/MRDRNA2_77725_c0_seq3.p2  ORF type:complete len:125 (-),score=3.51 gnl/MRDRNA2_/MRDRNA2_77725_c0_seq3:14-388(-)